MSSLFYIEKDTDLMRSTFMAFGLAHVLSRLQPLGQGHSVWIRDQGGAYQLEASLSQQDLLATIKQQGRLPAPLPVFTKQAPKKDPQEENLTKKKQKEAPHKHILPPHVEQVIDYDAEKKKLDEDRAQKKAQREEGAPPTRHPDFPLWAHLNSYFGKGSAMRKGYPLALHTWNKHQGLQAQQLGQLLMDYYGNFPNPREEAIAYWQQHIQRTWRSTEDEPFDWAKELPMVTGLAVVSPSTVQGAYSTTAAKGLNNEPQEVFWLDLYLALVGYMAVGIPYRSGGDVMLYYPNPKEISFEKARRLMQAYRQSGHVQQLYDYSGAFPRAKVDILSHLLFYQTVVAEHVKFSQTDDWFPPEAIWGITGYYYKDLGGTQIPFDETTFVFPAWIPPESAKAQLEQAGQNLEQHRKIIQSLKGDHAEELLILNHYRRFITYGDPDDWIEFAIAYTKHHFAKSVDEVWRPPLFVSIFEETLMNIQPDKKDYRPILEDEGFQNIARCIRSCTVQLRYIKDVKRQSTQFKVWHGLGDDLCRNAHNPDQFMIALSDFIQTYQHESAKVQADTGETRPYMTDEDLLAVIHLVNHYGSRVVASLLVAAGSCSGSSKSDK
jgi:hypothetical protein